MEGDKDLNFKDKTGSRVSESSKDCAVKLGDDVLDGVCGGLNVYGHEGTITIDREKVKEQIAGLERSQGIRIK